MRAERRILLVLGAALLIPACGGGGGGGSPDPASATAGTSSTQGSGQPPFIRLVTPASGSSCHEGATVTLKAIGTDPDSIIIRVDFYDGSRLIGSRTVSPFVISWGGMKAGTHVVTAVATDPEGLTATSEPVTVFVLGRHSDDDDDDDDDDDRKRRR